MKTITSKMVGKYLEGFGYVMKKDVGKRYVVRDGSYFVENDAQLTKRTAKKNPATKKAPRNRWIKASAVRVRTVGGRQVLDIKRAPAKRKRR